MNYRYGLVMEITFSRMSSHASYGKNRSRFQLCELAETDN